MWPISGRAMRSMSLWPTCGNESQHSSRGAGVGKGQHTEIWTLTNSRSHRREAVSRVRDGQVLEQCEAALRQLLHGQRGHLLHAEEQPRCHQELDDADQRAGRVQVVLALEGVIFIFRALMLERSHKDFTGVEHFLAKVPKLLRQRLQFRALAQ